MRNKLNKLETDVRKREEEVHMTRSEKNKINHQYTDDEHDAILENAIVALKKRGYNIK